MMRQRVAGWIPMLATALVLLTAGRGGLRAADSVETADTANSSALDFSDLSESIGRTVEPFELEDFRGKEHSLSAVPDERLTVVAFFGIECPLARLYAPRLAEVAGEFESRGVRFLVVDANRQDAVTEMDAFRRRYDLDLPFLKDLGNRLADQIGARRTPSVYVLDHERVIRYAGRIDDQYGINAGRSYQREKPQRRDLAEALEELLDGRDVSEPVTVAPGCIIGRVHAANDDAEVTYTNQIVRVLQNRCQSCHRENQIAPFALTSYDEAAGWADMIEEVVREQRMPPWHANAEFGSFANDCSLDDDEKQLIYDWINAGAPEGDPADLPPEQAFVSDWQIPREPDEVFAMSDAPFVVPAEGTVDYHYFTVDPGFTEDKWVRYAECRPGNMAVVHHIIVFIKSPTTSRGAGIESYELLSGFAPGTRHPEYGEGYAKRIPAGSKLIFQMHYTPNGSETTDLSRIGLVYADRADVTHWVGTGNIVNVFFEIPPRADNHKVELTRKLSRDTILLSMFPHMHLRGKAFRYTAIYPDGSEEVLLDVPRYDFNWQYSFVLDEPKRLPAGTRVHCEARFDNSEENLANPDPTQTVRWGDQTWEEMMIGWYDEARPVDEYMVEATESEARAMRIKRRAEERRLRKEQKRKEPNEQAG